MWSARLATIPQSSSAPDAANLAVDGYVLTAMSARPPPVGLLRPADVTLELGASLS